ncbi:MAG: response regulator [Candidatus Omnitrophica bacterium]|nr:response regulator [Candidatus Omnitrophota bacterium]
MAYQILIVDDDADFRQEMAECLSRYRVTEARNGQEAIEILKRPNAIDCVVLDVIMPQMSGIEVLRQIRTLQPNLGIIILTGQSTKDFAIDALKAHADDYIEKPFEVDKFLRSIQKILDSKSKTPHSPIYKMDRIKRFIENNVDKKMSLNDVAEEVCLSPKYLSRYFKKNTGLGFNEYRLKLKMQEAQRILKTSEATVDQISLKLGYKNPESFIRIFEKFVNATPTQYRLKSKDHPNGRKR